MSFSRRQRRVWGSIGATLLGCGVLTGVGLWVQSSRDTDLEDPTAGVTANFKGSQVASPIRLRDVARELGVVMRHGPGPRGRALVEDTGSGVAWCDYDMDGDWDLYLVSFPGPLRGQPDPAGSNRLFRNDGGRFTDVTEAAGVGDADGFGMGATFADYDDDGDPDLYVTNYGPNRLYRNLGDGTFEEIAAQAGVDDPLWSAGAAWGDFDRDGHLDLYVCNYVDYDDTGVEPAQTPGGNAYSVPFTLNPNSFDPQPNRLYRNLGDGTFQDVAEHCRVDNPEGRSLAATLCDLDGDGWLDLYVNNDVSTNKLYRNLGMTIADGGPVQFFDLSAMTGTADPRGSMGLSVGEIGAMTGEPDGFPDLFITHWVAQENAFYQSVTAEVGKLEYRDKTRRLRLGEISIDTVGWGSALVDLDLDGRLDIAVANGSTLEHEDRPLGLVAEPSFIFWNVGKHFADVAPGSGAALARPHRARGLAAADFDGDGDVDLAISMNRGQPLLLRNETEAGNTSPTVTLRGPAAACFGARVTLQVAGEKQMRWWGADVTYLGMHATDLIFGLGEHGRAEVVNVSWSDGSETKLTDVAAGSVVVVHPKRKNSRQD